MFTVTGEIVITDFIKKKNKQSLKSMVLETIIEIGSHLCSLTRLSTSSSSHLDIPKNGNGEFQKTGSGLFMLRNSAG